jgi:hypothetical protein
VAWQAQHPEHLGAKLVLALYWRRVVKVDLQPTLGEPVEGQRAANPRQAVVVELRAVLVSRLRTEVERQVIRLQILRIQTAEIF